MKPFLFIYSSLLALLCSCDGIEPENRLIRLPNFEAQRNVLIEDFTGQECVNCPTMANEIHEFKKAYAPNQIIPVAIHATKLAIESSGNIVGLKTPFGDEYFKPLGVNGIPRVRINRASKPLGIGKWSSSLPDILSKKAGVSLILKTHLSTDNTQLNIETRMVSVENYNKPKLQLWLVEDSIKAIQALRGRVDEEYIHNHVLRDAINGIWGEDIKLEEGKEVVKKTTYTLPKNVNVKHVYVVAFVYNDDLGVLQVVKE